MARMALFLTHVGRDRKSDKKTVLNIRLPQYWFSAGVQILYSKVRVLHTISFKMFHLLREHYQVKDARGQEVTTIMLKCRAADFFSRVRELSRHTVITLNDTRNSRMPPISELGFIEKLPATIVVISKS